ncbi:hypothetical protein V496_03267 [Pseudogymnoascus sp. VKM F-4515 (FW-2607)]|nr:hypothetical protein V496_03267 [Pseudogymnoascus sp. VKM F-4515 (FW-2607)]KFY70342.1 hypothetical protein V498_10364 [Pseudogymnoascus sp. VKM F-4517 (FW-2822)]
MTQRGTAAVRGQRSAGTTTASPRGISKVKKGKGEIGGFSSERPYPPAASAGCALTSASALAGACLRGGPFLRPKGVLGSVMARMVDG